MPDLNGPFLSIDQNSNVFWDTLPKLAALARRGLAGRHCVEDIDVAFTRQGAAPGDTALRLEPEGYYRSGNTDWGAALFYTKFLGRNPVNPRGLEPYTGQTTAALARQQDLTLDAFYERYAGSDNWQVTGPSYLTDQRLHRCIGDLAAAETAPFLRQLLELARGDLLERFPEPAAQARLTAWFDRETARLNAILAECAGGSLVQVYQAWTRAHVPDTITVSTTAEWFQANPDLRLLSLFLNDYARCVALYNDAIAATGTGQTPLHPDRGDLPFFAVFRRDGRLIRAPLTVRDGWLEAGDRRWRLPDPGRPATLAESLGNAWRHDGVICLAGKALLLVIQARSAPHGASLALPHLGSLYLPAAHEFQRRLRAAGLLDWPVAPVWRVRFHFLDRWRDCPTRVRVPEWLAGVFQADEAPAGQLAAELPQVQEKAAAELAAMRSDAGRQTLQEQLWPRLTSEIRGLDTERRALARDPARRAEAAALWARLKPLERELARRHFERALRNLQLRGLDYWDSRGALLPWSIALGGEAFYDRLLAGAEISTEDPEAAPG